MKRRFTILTAALALLAFLAIPMGMWGQSTKTEGFESAQTSSTYNGTVSVSANQSDCGIGWSIYYGTVSTMGALYGNNSAQMRWYKSALTNYPYLKSTTAIDGLTNVAFKAKVGHTDVKMDVYYSSDGDNWTALATAVAFSNTNVTDCSYDIPSGGKYIKIGISSSSTAPNGTYYSLLVDNVVFTYSGDFNTYTVTYHANVTGTADIEVEYNEGDDVTVAANTFSNPGYAFTEWNTEADGSGDNYAPGDVIEDIDDDIDLYAQWEVSTSTTGNIKFGSSTGHVKINAPSVTGDDDLGNEWTITTVGTTSFTQSSIYSQVGSGSNPATSITFTTTLPEEVDVTAMEVKFGGFNGTAGTITMKVGNTTIGTGSLNGAADVVINSNSTETGDELTVTVTGISKGVKAYYISYTYEATGSAVATTTTISVPSDFNNDLHNGTNAGTLSATVTAEGTAISGASVTWSSSDTGVATIDANGVVTLVAVGTTTITASYAGVEGQYRPSSDTYELAVIDSNAPGTVNNPYTVAQAIANTPSNGNVYIQGIVSSFYNTSIIGDGTNYRYYISDDGTTTTQLLVYKGKGLNQTTFTNADDLLVGDEVVIYGTLITYQSAPEVASGNYLYSWNRPVAAVEAPVFSPAAGTYATAQSVTISCATSPADIYYTTDGSEPDGNSTLYDGNAITISSTTTLKAIAYSGGANSTVATATYHINSQDTPYTVTQALAFNEYPANGIYVSGIVSTAPTQNPTNNGELTYYISVDGNATNQLEVYKGKGLEQAAFTSIDDIQVGDIVTIYGNVVIYNNTKEFAQGNYLVSFERPAQQYTLTVTCSTNVEIFTFVDPNEQGVEGPTTQQVTSGTEVGISVSATTGYILTLMVDGIDVTSQLDETGYYAFYMPTHDVTVTATAVEDVPPVGGDYVRITSLDQLTDGSKVIIAARYDEEHTNGYYAMSNATSGKPTGVQFTSTTSGDNEILPVSIVNDEDDYYWTVNVTANGYTFTNADGDMIGYGTSGTNFVTGGTNTEWTIESGTAGNSAMVAEYTGFVIKNKTTASRAFAFNGSVFGAYATTNMNASGYNFFLDFFVQSEDAPVTETYTLDIAGYREGSNGGYHLIASPVAVDPATVEGMTDGDFDLYYFDEAEVLEWQNYEAETFSLVPGKGYLYAKKATTEGEVFHFTLTGTPYDGEPIILKKTTGGDFPGWNLVGNPYDQTISIDRDYYTMNADGTALELVTGRTIQPKEGFFVLAAYDGEEMSFSTEIPAGRDSKIIMNLRNARSSVVDRAMIRFGEGSMLPKLMLNQNDTKLYITEGNEEYAVVCSNNDGEMPVNFKAAENGTYTLGFNVENVEMNYLHLIDNMTNTDIDLLTNPSYSFEATTTDNANRFKLVFATGNTDDNFAYYSNGSFVITNEGNATLQVIDVKGRIISNETINGCANVDVDAANGVYMLRLVNGDNVKVQKVVVR